MTRWTIADARKRFAEVLGASAREPQAIYNRDRLVAAVVAPEHAERIPSLADAFAELRRVAVEENYEQLEVPRRKDRPNPFVRGRR